MEHDTDMKRIRSEAGLVPIIPLTAAKTPATQEYATALREAHRQVEKASSSIFASMLAVACSREWAEWDAEQPEGTQFCFGPEDFEDVEDPQVRQLLDLYLHAHALADSLAEFVGKLPKPPRKEPSASVILGDDHSHYSKLMLDKALLEDQE